MSDCANGSNAAVDATADNTREQAVWRGCAMEEIYRNLNAFELDHMPAVRPSEHHTVLHFYPIINKADNVPPAPLRAQQKWDNSHVRLPCSNKSQYPVTAADGSSSIASRWQMIENALSQPINDSQALQAAILCYNSKYAQQWNFIALHQLFEQDLDESEVRVFFEDLLPRIIKLALRLPELLQAPIPLLKQGMNHAITLTQQQVSCLLANAFLCTFPRRNTLKRKSEYSTFPQINFNRLFQCTGQPVLEKIKCLLHYFRRVCATARDSSNVPTGVLTFMRRHLRANELPNWSQLQMPLGLTPLHITSQGTIEDQGLGLLQVDFANKYLGGGVLGHGCVQEEIRFVICPELLVCKLFTECLLPTEALIMVGCERYSNYTGYAESFCWAGNHDDFVPCDSSRRRMTHIVAIDALLFQQSAQQFREELMLRELNKAYVGFTHNMSTAPPAVASGNWGCGAFGGEARLKALLQLMACAATKRPLVYFTFGDVELRDELHQMHNYLRQHDVRVSELWTILCKFKKQQLPAQELYEFIKSCHQQKLKGQRSPIKKLKQIFKKPTTATNTQTTTTTIILEDSTAKELANQSIDLFASSSSSDCESLCNAAQSPFSAAANLSEDTDALLLAAAASLDKNMGLQSNEKSAAAAECSKEASPQTPSRKGRQRTLLEMLDQCYTKTAATTTTTNAAAAAPDAKRQCTNK